MVVEAASLSKLLSAQVARELVPGQTRLDFLIIAKGFLRQLEQVSIFLLFFLRRMDPFVRLERAKRLEILLANHEIFDSTRP